MKSGTSNKIALAFAGILAVLVLFLGVGFAHANPGFFSQMAATSDPTFTALGNPSTSTTSYIHAGGVATTTLTADVSTNKGTKADSAMVYLIVNATSTANISSPVIKARVEYSYDNLDWYPESAELSTLSTTTVMTGTYKERSFTLATSTTDYGGSGSVAAPTSTTMYAFKVDTPARYVRVKFYSPAPQAARLAIWAAIQPWKEAN